VVASLLGSTRPSRRHVFYSTLPPKLVVLGSDATAGSSFDGSACGRHTDRCWERVEVVIQQQQQQQQPSKETTRLRLL